MILHGVINQFLQSYYIESGDKCNVSLIQFVLPVERQLTSANISPTISLKFEIDDILVIRTSDKMVL